MDLPITDQPGGFTMPNKNPDNLAGLEVLGQMSELMIKQRHPGCLECKLLTYYLGLHRSLKSKGWIFQ